jgi:hypothetical protein
MVREPSYALVFIRLTSGGRRVSGLRVGRPENGMVRVFARGRTLTVAADRVSRARRSLAARAIHIRLAAEYARIQAAMEDLKLRGRRIRRSVL